MAKSRRPRYRPGDNIAVKTPAHLFEATVAFYADTLGFEEVARQAGSVVFDFAGKRLWIDRVPHLSRCETWLEVRAEDVGAAAADLAAQGVLRCDAVEPLPEGFKGFWVLSPAGQVHLLAEPQA